MTEFLQVFANQFGLLALYALINLYFGFIANNLKHLIFMLGISCGVYIAMFQAFNLKSKLGVLDVSRYIEVSGDLANMVMAVVFVYVLGFSAFGLKSMIVRSAEE